MMDYELVHWGVEGRIEEETFISAETYRLIQEIIDEGHKWPGFVFQKMAAKMEKIHKDLLFLEMFQESQKECLDSEPTII